MYKFIIELSTVDFFLSSLEKERISFSEFLLNFIIALFLLILFFAFLMSP